MNRDRTNRGGAKRAWACLLAGAFLLAGASGAAAQLELDTVRISELGAGDREFMAQQRERIDDLARRRIGRQLRGEKANDLDVLQTLLKRRIIRRSQNLELQAMGVVLGDLLSQEFGLKWVIYEDTRGRSRALEAGENHLFPISMVSYRASAGAKVDVRELYQEAADIVRHFHQRPAFR